MTSQASGISSGIKKLHRNGRAGFSLLELSIVLIIVATLTGLGIQSGANMIETSRVVQTNKKIEQIKRAIYAFRVSNNRIPCPASLTLAVSAPNFGVQGPNASACMDATAGAATASRTSAAADVVEGAVPTKNLSLPDEFAFDGWGNRIRYAVSSVYTQKNAFSASGLTETCPGPQVQDGTGGTNFRTQNAVYVLLSQGSSAHGAYTRSGTIKNAGSVNTSELENCDCNSSGTTTTLNGVYVQKNIANNPSVANDSFDDIVEYQTRWQMQTGYEQTVTSVFLGPDLVPSTVPMQFYKLNTSTDTFSTMTSPTFTTAACRYNVNFSPDNKFISQGFGCGPYITAIYGSGCSISPFNYVTSLPTGSREQDWSNDSTYLALATSNPEVIIYKRTNTSFSRLADATPAPASFVFDVDFSNDGNYLAVAHNSAPMISIYSRTGDAFSRIPVSYTVPSTGAAYGVSFSKNDDFLAAAVSESPYLYIYSNSGGTFTKLPDPTILPSGGASLVAFSNNSDFLAVTSGNNAQIYSRTGSTFTALPIIILSATATAVSWSWDDQYIAFTDSGAPWTQVYKRSGSTFALLPGQVPNSPGVAFRH